MFHSTYIVIEKILYSKTKWNLVIIMQLVNKIIFAVVPSISEK